jgi:hypothetical protein
MPSPEHSPFQPRDALAPDTSLGRDPYDQIETQNFQQRSVSNLSNSEQSIPSPFLVHTSATSALDSSPPTSSLGTEGVCEAPLVTGALSMRGESSPFLQELWGELKRTRRQLWQETGYVAPIAGGVDHLSKNGGNRRRRDLGFYVQVVPRLAIVGGLPVPPRPRDFSDQGSYQEAVGEHMERVWEILDHLPDEKIALLTRWCGPYEELQELWHNWDEYTSKEREEAVLKWRKRFRRDP